MSEEIDPQPIMSEERTLESYTQLLTDYSSFERELEELENLQYRWETTLASEKYSDNELYVKIGSTVEAIQGKLRESVPLCDYIDNSPFKVQCYRLFKENFDNMKGFKLPETGQEFLVAARLACGHNERAHLGRTSGFPNCLPGLRVFLPIFQCYRLDNFV